VVPSKLRSPNHSTVILEPRKCIYLRNLSCRSSYSSNTSQMDGSEQQEIVMSPESLCVTLTLDPSFNSTSPVAFFLATECSIVARTHWLTVHLPSNVWERPPNLLRARE
jgi:hypothetical protein